MYRCPDCFCVFDTATQLESHEFYTHDLDLNAVDIDLDECAPVEAGLRELKRVTVDSGAGDSCINPGDLPDIPLEESPGSKRGQMYAGPGGEQIPNQGQKKAGIMLEDGAMKQMTFQAAKVRKPLLAVSGACDRNQIVLFDSMGSFICPASSPEVAQIRELVAKIKDKIAFKRENGVYTMRTWLLPPDGKDQGFHRQGK